MKKFNIAIPIIAILFLVVVYNSSDDSEYFFNVENALKSGKYYACAILKSDKKTLLKNLRYNDEYEKNKINKSTFNTTSQDIFYDHYDTYIFEHFDEESIYDISSSDKEKYNRMQLLAIDVIGENIYVMTFGYKTRDMCKFLEIPNKGEMIFSVAMDYVAPHSGIIKEILRKVFNIPLLRVITKKYGTTGKWYLLDYEYTYNLNDYAEWICNNKKFESQTEHLYKKVDEALKEANSASAYFNNFNEGSFTDKIFKQIELEEKMARNVLKTQNLRSRIILLYSQRIESKTGIDYLKTVEAKKHKKEIQEKNDWLEYQKNLKNNIRSPNKLFFNSENIERKTP